MTFPLLLTTSSKVTQERLPGKESRRTSASEARPRQQANPGQTPARGRPHASPLRLQDRPRRDCCTFCSLGGTDVARPAFPSSSGKKDAEEERRAQKMRRAKKKRKKERGRCERTFYPFVHKLQVRPEKLKVALPAARGVRRRVLGQDKGAGERACGVCGRSDGRVPRGFECEQSGSDQRPATAGRPRWPPALTETRRARCGGSGVPKRRPGRRGQLATINRSARLPSRPIRRLLNPTFTNFHRPESCTCWLSKLRQPRSHGPRAPESDEKMLIPED